MTTKITDKLRGAVRSITDEQHELYGWAGLALVAFGAAFDKLTWQAVAGGGFCMMMMYGLAHVQRLSVGPSRGLEFESRQAADDGEPED